MERLAILSGAGQLPVALAMANPEAVRVRFAGVESALQDCVEVRFEHLGGLFEFLAQEGVTRVVMAGAMSRPQFDPSAFDDTMMSLAPRLQKTMQGGDDRLLREIIAIFNERGLKVVGAHEVLPELTATPGLLAGSEPNEGQLSDLLRADAILSALSPVDVGQAVVVEGGLCLGIETLQGTDALLDFVAQTPDHLRQSGGVLVKRPKAGQDLRVDMPTIGPNTIVKAANAGLAGLVISPGSVLLLDRERLVEEATKHNLFLLARGSA